MFLLRINFIACACMCVLLLSSCVSINGGGAPPKKDEWSGVPKPYISGLKAAQQGESKTAIKFFKRSVDEFPGFAPAYTNLGLQQLRLKKRSAAKESLEKSIKVNAENAVAYQHLGVIARLDGDFDVALSRYQKALDINPDYALAHLNLGILLDLYLYDLEPALAHYEKYQSLAKKKDAKVSKWIVEIKRRIARNKKR